MDASGKGLVGGRRVRESGLRKVTVAMRDNGAARALLCRVFLGGHGVCVLVTTLRHKMEAGCPTIAQFVRSFRVGWVYDCGLSMSLRRREVPACQLTTRCRREDEATQVR